MYDSLDYKGEYQDVADLTLSYQSHLVVSNGPSFEQISDIASYFQLVYPSQDINRLFDINIHDCLKASYQGKTNGGHKTIPATNTRFSLLKQRQVEEIAALAEKFTTKEETEVSLATSKPSIVEDAIENSSFKLPPQDGSANQFGLVPIIGPNEILHESCKGKRPLILFDNSTGIVLAVLGRSGKSTGIVDPNISPKVCFLSWKTQRKNLIDETVNGGNKNARGRAHRSSSRSLCRRNQRLQDVVLTVQGSAANSRFYINGHPVKGNKEIIDLAHGDVLSLGKHKKNQGGAPVYRYRVVVIGQQTKITQKRKNSDLHEDQAKKKERIVNANRLTPQSRKNFRNL